MQKKNSESFNRARPIAARPRGSITAVKTPSKGYRDWILAIALIVTTFLIYQPAWHGKGLLDDVDRFLKTPEQRSTAGLVRLWVQPRTNRQYHPLIDTVYWVEDKLWHRNFLGYHLITIALHAASALLLLAILRKLQIRGAWLATALFAFHPITVESVAWMVEIKNTLSGLFFFAAILTYLKFDERRSVGAYLLLLFLFAAGILAKSIVATVPAVVLILIWWKRGRLEWRRDVLPLTPFVVLAIAAGLLTAWMERAFSGAAGKEFDLPLIDRILVAGRAFWFYIGKLFFPVRLSMIYPRWKIDPTIWWQYLFPLAMLGFFIFVWRQRRRARWLLAASLYFLVTIGALLGFFNVSYFGFSYVADHFAYLPSLAVIVPISAGAMWLMDRRPLAPSIMRGSAIALLGVSAIASWMQSHMYRDPQTCYRTIIARHPTSWTAHENIGEEYLARGDLDAATVEFEKVLELEPNYSHAGKRASFGLGTVLLRKGEFDKAIEMYEQALKYDINYGEAYNGIASALHRQGRLADSIAEYQVAVKLRPDSEIILSNFAWLLATCADPALRDGPRAVSIAKHADFLTGHAYPRVLRSLAAAYAEMGQFQQAAATARWSLELWLQEGETPFTEALRREIALYDQGLPYHEAPLSGAVGG